MSSSLVPEETWIEENYAWVLVEKLLGLRVSISVFFKLSLMMFPEETLKASNASTKIEFM